MIYGAIGCAFVLLGAFAAFGMGILRLCLEQQQEGYDQLVATLAAERDHARHEAEVWRGMMIPKFNKVEAVSGEPRQSTDKLSGEGKSVERGSPKAASARKIPARGTMRTRDYFNLVRQLSNTGQRRQDALAKALTTQVPQEKQNVKASA